MGIITLLYILKSWSMDDIMKKFIEITEVNLKVHTLSKSMSFG